MYCRTCGTKAADETAPFCRTCGNPLAPPNAQARIIVVKPRRSPGIAAVLSFFWCGLGQIYNGQIGKGIAMGSAYFFSGLLMYVAIGFITTPILWIWGMVDAYRTAERLNRKVTIAAPPF
jgi:TM2 domain-containing membrane protein YozV